MSSLRTVPLEDLTLPSSSRLPWYVISNISPISLLLFTWWYKLSNINQWRQSNRANVYSIAEPFFYQLGWLTVEFLECLTTISLPIEKKKSYRPYRWVRYLIISYVLFKMKSNRSYLLYGWYISPILPVRLNRLHRLGLFLLSCNIRMKEQKINWEKEQKSPAIPERIARPFCNDLITKDNIFLCR